MNPYNQWYVWMWFCFFISNHTPYKIKEYIEKIILNHHLHIIGSQIHIFSKNAFSLNIMLAESHLCLHTWPEDNYVSLDIFVCNYTCDNSQNAKNIFQEIKTIFASKDEKTNIINR